MKKASKPLTSLQFHLLPIRDWNDKIGIGEPGLDIAISFTPY